MSSTISNRKQRKVKQHKTNMSQYLPVPLISSISNVAQIQILPLESLGQARHLKLHQDHPLDFEWKNDCQSEATKKCHVDLSKLRNSNTFFYPFLGSLSACTWVASVICTWASQAPGETYTEKPKNSTFDNVIHKRFYWTWSLHIDPLHY